MSRYHFHCSQRVGQDRAAPTSPNQLFWYPTKWVATKLQASCKSETTHTIFSRFDLQVTFCTSPRSERPKHTFKNGNDKWDITKLSNFPFPNLPTIGGCPRHHPSQQTPHAEREIWYRIFLDQTGVTLTSNLSCYLCWAAGARHLRFIDLLTKLTNYCLTISLTKLSLITLVWRWRLSNFRLASSG